MGIRLDKVLGELARRLAACVEALDERDRNRERQRAALGGNGAVLVAEGGA